MDLADESRSQSRLAIGVKFRIELEYDGTHFAGWQFQPGERTVQDCPQQAVGRLFGEPATVIGSGRTDAGVHARGQVAHFVAHGRRTPQVVCRALNALLPDDVRVIRAEYADSEFHARYSARWRYYRYRIARRSVALGRAYTWECPFHFQISPMQQAVQYILGDHVFRSFAHDRETEQHYLSTVYHAEWIERDPFCEFHIAANRFLHGMVRFLVGTFVEIGRGKRAVEDFPAILSACDVRQAGQKCPARGLTLMEVGYSAWSSEAISSSQSTRNDDVEIR
ncbi:MAG: tRNA pseudouridine(38-40) synthase TruA [bacterium]|nr:tRNA pseudouridine(38-40) synthase TruA [bacterium]